MHKIRIAEQQLATGEFTIISDEYLIRPAKQDFWRLDSKSGGELVVTRVVGSAEEDGAPDILETECREVVSAQLRHNPNRLADPGVVPQIQEVGLATDGLFVFLDEKGHTYQADKLVGTPPFRALGPRLRELVAQLAEVQGTILVDSNDTGWGPQYQALSDFLTHQGPVALEGLPFKRLVGMVESLLAASRQSHVEKAAQGLTDA